METSAPSESSVSQSTGPPDLDYSLRARKKSIAFFWILCLVDVIGVPIALYFGLWYGTSLSPNAVFSISTATLGGVSLWEYFLRSWRLWKKNSTCRCHGAPRLYLDWFHWIYSFAWFLIMFELILGTVQHNPPIRVLAMPVATMCWTFGISFLLQDIARARGIRVPLRISSMPAGAPLRPSLYSIIEDIVAVDGCGGTAYRDRLNARYEASSDFRAMIHRQSVFWTSGCLAASLLTTVLIWTIQRDAAYVIGWTVPFIWAGIWTWITIPWVQRDLRREKENWEKPGPTKA